MKEARVRASKEFSGHSSHLAPRDDLLSRSERTTLTGDRKKFIEQIRQALYASKICSYAQGFVQLQEAAKEHDWPLNFGNIALLWRGGCIIRARFLEHIKAAFDENPRLENLLLARYFKKAVQEAQPAWRHVVSTAVELGIPVPAFSTALTYFDSYREARLPANLLQAQRDYFGAHTYERIDKSGTFHTDWLAKRRPPT
jgi:6-phosphogluconate dehydrogenase